MMTEYKMEKETALVEAILYLEGEPLDDAAISKIAGLSVDVVKECIKNLKDSYSEGSSGIEITQMMGGWIITPKKEFWDALKDRYGKKNDNRLSRAAMETQIKKGLSTAVLTDKEAAKKILALVPEEWIKKKLIIPKECKADILRELALLGITDSYIYPGMEQYAKELKKKLSKICGRLLTG